jgi:hypothetical protein
LDGNNAALLALVVIPSSLSYLLGSSDSRKNTMGRGGAVKRLRRYSNNGYGSDDSNVMTACIRVAWQGYVNDDDFLDDNKYNIQQEIQ